MGSAVKAQMGWGKGEEREDLGAGKRRSGSWSGAIHHGFASRVDGLARTVGLQWGKLGA